MSSQQVPDPTSQGTCRLDDTRGIGTAAAFGRHIMDSRGLVGWFAAVGALGLTAILPWRCSYVDTRVDPDPVKQGDRAHIRIEAGGIPGPSELRYRINGVDGSTTQWVHEEDVETCRYHAWVHNWASLSVWTEARFGNRVITDGPRVYDLTHCSDAREDSDRGFGVYVAHDADQDNENNFLHFATGFLESFDSYTQSQYFWSEPHFFLASSPWVADSVDLAFAVGHGQPHLYQAGSSNQDIVDFSKAAYGGCASCGPTGDLEYLVVMGCDVLSMNDAGEDYRNPSPIQPYWWFWLNAPATARERRPFAGLHMVLSFRTGYLLDRVEGREFTSTFADRLDAGMTVIDAWQGAAVGLDFSDGANRTAVLYLGEYEGDTIRSSRDDYLYPNPKYADVWIDYYE